MRIWVDLTNSPHALLFAPIVRALQSRGDDVLVTVRRFAHTPELARGRFDEPRVVGTGAASSIPGKVAALQSRVRALAAIAKHFRPDVAASHGSYDQVLAARALKVPSLVSVDYEYQPANHLSFRLANRLLLPAAFDEADIARHGGHGKVWRYYGLKEEAYLADFVPRPELRGQLPVSPNATTIVLLRPPPRGALYHRGGNPVYDQLLESLRRRDDVATLVLPRHPADVAALVATVEGGGVKVVREAVEGPDVIWLADVVVSGGGTMNREAVVLGTPALTTFAGRLGAVDQDLIAQGRLGTLRRPEEVAAFIPQPRPARERPQARHDVLRQFLDAIDRTSGGR